MKILIADSGSTKTSWITLEDGIKSEILETRGINPVRDSKEYITEVIAETRVFPLDKIEKVYFFGAGCINPYKQVVEAVLQESIPGAEVHVESDMLGAAIALCGHHEGIACIMGTGSNSCLFDGEKIVQQTPALGFILGDEGSGSVLGKRLVSDILKKQLPEDICNAFFSEFNLSAGDIIERVYRKPQPNLFLSSFTYFIANNLERKEIEDLVVDEFKRFLERNISNYKRTDLPVHFVGGISGAFQKQLQKAVEEKGMLMGKIIKKPIELMADYYLS